MIVWYNSQCMTALFSCHHLPIREQGSYKERSMMHIRLICGIRIGNIVFAQNDRRRIFTLNDNTRAQRHWLGDTLIPDRHLIEIGTFIKCDQPALADRITTDDTRTLTETDFKAQRSLCHHLKTLKTVRHSNTVTNHQSWRSAAKRCSYLIRIKAFTMIMMIRIETIQGVTTMSIDTTQGINLGHHHDIFNVITIVDHQLWRILGPYINTK